MGGTPAVACVTSARASSVSLDRFGSWSFPPIRGSFDCLTADLSSEVTIRTRLGVLMSEFSVQAVDRGSQREMMLTGEVDLEVTDGLVEVALTHLADIGVESLSLDLAGVTFMDSTGLGALVAIRNAANEQGKELVVLNIPDGIRRLFVLTGLTTVFAVNSNGGTPRGD
jgi:anti-sigma B factor antagonist